MKNEYGQELDRNGYAETLLPFTEGSCTLCGRRDRPLQRHEVFAGPYRQKSKRYGCWVVICDVCHAKFPGNGDSEWRLKGIMQKRSMERYGWTVDDFRRIFGKAFHDE